MTPTLVGADTENRPILDRRIWLRRPVRWIAGVDPIIKEFRFVEIGLDFVKLQLLKVSIFFLWRNGRTHLRVRRLFQVATLVHGGFLFQVARGAASRLASIEPKNILGTGREVDPPAGAVFRPQADF